MSREEFVPVFEEDESVILGRMIDSVPDTWRKEVGDFMHDAVAPAAPEIKQLQIGQDEVLKNAFAIYAEEEYLDKKLAEVGMTRHPATPNIRRLAITADAGVTIPAGYEISAVIQGDDGNPLEYTTNALLTFSAADTLNVDLTAVEAGTVGNLATGSQFILMPPLPGVSQIVDLGTLTMGVDIESDEDAYVRYEFKIQNPDTGGNKSDYVRWTTDLAGVGAAQCIPRWDGNGTVKVVFVGEDMQPDASLVTTVQNYLDPGSQGLGEGKAPLGAKVTVVTATAKNIDITATVTYSQAYAVADVKDAFNAALQSYLTNLIFTGTPVIYNKVGSLLIGTPGVDNYSGLTINGGTVDVTVGAEEVAVKGTITI